MRSYNQHCALAKALDVIGDRWTLLIVRELLVSQGSRYTDLQAGLPGIASNLLAERLRQLETSGIIERENAPPPVATALFRLTERGKDLEPVLAALGRWGLPLLDSLKSDNSFRTRVLRLPLRMYLAAKPGAPLPFTLLLQTGDEPLTVLVTEQGVETRMGRPKHSDLVLTGDAHPIMALLMEASTLEAAHAAGVRLEGDERILQRIGNRHRT